MPCAIQNAWRKAPPCAGRGNSQRRIASACAWRSFCKAAIKATSAASSALKREHPGRWNCIVRRAAPDRISIRHFSPFKAKVGSRPPKATMNSSTTVGHSAASRSQRRIEPTSSSSASAVRIAEQCRASTDGDRMLSVGCMVRGLHGGGLWAADRESRRRPPRCRAGARPVRRLVVILILQISRNINLHKHPLGRGQGQNKSGAGFRRRRLSLSMTANVQAAARIAAAFTLASTWVSNCSKFLAKRRVKSWACLS